MRNELQSEYYIVSGPGAVRAGAVQITIFNNGAADGILKGSRFPTGAPALSWPLISPETGYTYEQIDFDATGTEFLVSAEYPRR